ncbi:MAG TPA: GEVED domain-containing protein, partial [Chitinophagaceae bacterium]|nr:GEVED domain-containing protein [Chitinophagaceae bacterium]
CKVSCGATGTFAYSNTLFMPMAPSYACYCASAAQSDADEDIVKFTLGSMRNCSNCSSVAPGLGSVQNIYSNYQSVSPAIVQKGSLVPFVIDVGICGSNVYPNRCAIFIDFNQNNSFADAGELVYSSSSGTSGPHSESGTILIPATALTGLTGVRVINSEQGTAISDPCLSYPWGETEDYLVNILPAAACSGTPVPGNSVVEVSGSCTPVSGTYEVCSGKTLTLTISNLVAGTGFQYQWYENGFPISGATNGAYTTNAVTSAKVYYCRVTCINSGLSANSTPVNITLSSFLNCYCTSAATQVADQEILSFTLNGASTVSDCVTPAGGSGSLLNRYANYTNLGSITNLTIGGSTSFSAFVDDCDIPPPPYYSFGTAIWIDLNHNGSFNDAGEQLFVEGVPVAGPRTVSGTLSIPCTALPGLTRLRILIAEGFSGATLTPCMAYGFGETEDYLVNLTSTATTCTLPIPSPGNTLSTVNTFCDSTTATLSISNNCISSGYSFQWYKNGVAVTGATSRNYTTPMQYATSSWYCKVSCGSNFLNSTTITITKSNSTVG